jgi:uncharacterized LabA/DUF88 family protein
LEDLPFLNGSDRLKIAVFIDFDNIEIGVKSTLNRHFDVGTVLEAIKERGEVVTKIAYGDWKRAGDHSRSMSQHAIQMVQRNLTPGGDKNGADINLALDALEMAFTRSHINAFVIVGGDSDFMALVEKLKQYDKKVMVLGGRAFTSIILQKNCHEFIAYENLIAAPPPQASSSSRRPAERSRSTLPGGDANLSKALPLVRRALKVLSDREVSPQLGLLKSTLLQLDSTFTERDYGASTFRDFIEKMAAAGYVNLKQVDRSLLVELKDVEGAPAAAAVAPAAHGEDEDPPQPTSDPSVTRSPLHSPSRSAQQHAPVQPAPPPLPQGPATPAQIEEGVRALFDAFQTAKTPPHWPMYLRNVKQYVKNSAPSFEERRYGFVNFLEAVRACGRAGLFRLERNRQGILRIFAGPQFPQSGNGNLAAQEGAAEVPAIYDVANDEVANDEVETTSATPVFEEQAPVMDTEPVQEVVDESPSEEAVAVPVRKRRPTTRAAAGTSTKKKPAAPRKTKKKAADKDEDDEQGE